MNETVNNDMKRKGLSKEAQMQIHALRKIRIWRTIVIALSTIDVAITYAALGGEQSDLPAGILGICLIVVSTLCAVLFNLGWRNGTKNVEKILNVLEGRAYEVYTADRQNLQ